MAPKLLTCLYTLLVTAHYFTTSRLAVRANIVAIASYQSSSITLFLRCILFRVLYRMLLCKMRHSQKRVKPSDSEQLGSISFKQLATDIGVVYFCQRHKCYGPHFYAYFPGCRMWVLRVFVDGFAPAPPPMRLWGGMLDDLPF
jgi:hypothetical protein